MRILLDGMGGDYSPEEIVKGAVKAANEIDETIAIIGPEDKIQPLLTKYHANKNVEVVNATEVITNEEHPAMAIRRKKDSTIVKGMNMVKAGEADVFISAGSTGALLSGALLILGRIKGIKRPAIASWFPQIGKNNQTLLLDCGANADAKPEYLYQFGIMGSIFVHCIKGLETPVVKLLNVGAEDAKGDDLHKEAFDLLKDGPLNFCGNIEGRDVIFGDADVVVADGFSGNVFLKGSEGTALCMSNLMKEKLTDGLLAKAGAALAYKKIKEIKSEFDYADAGGAPILGVKGAVLKIHGNSKEKEVYYAIKKAIPYVKNDVTGMIADAILESSVNEDAEETTEQ